MLTTVLVAGGLQVWLDTSHGTADIDLVGNVPLVMTRDLIATRSSYAAGWEGHEAAVPIDDSLKGIARRYPLARRVSYERLCGWPHIVVHELAEYFGIAPWYCPVTMIAQNQKWYDGTGGPQLGNGAPRNGAH